MTHLTRDQLLAWRDAPSELERGRIVGHLAICDECGAAYAELIRTRPADAARSSFDERAFVSRGYEAARPAVPRLLQPRVWMPLAAAAALAVALVLPRSGRESPPPADPDTVRGSRLEAVAPVGRVEGPLEFRWVSPYSAARYVVEFTESDGTRVTVRETRFERLAMDAELERVLVPGTSYTWTVTALDAAGDVIGRSAPREFSRVRSPQ